MIISKPHRDDEDDKCEECLKLFSECTICLNLICKCENGCTCGEIIEGQS